ncbi:MAG: UDP-N-acetylglucosamine 2-epimerase (non-hydrolyzing) [Chitinophagales bacterium]
MKKIYVVVGTRPNFIKVSQLQVHAAHYGFSVEMIHTGQHYDEALSRVFFKQFGMEPDHFLSIPSSQTGADPSIMQEAILSFLQSQERPDLLLVVGDVHSTRAAAEAGHALHIPLAHLESGLRSFDNTMPEEENRIIADALSTFHFTTEPAAAENLQNENISADSIFYIGNTMIDTLVAFEHQIQTSKVLDDLHIDKQKYILITLHRPSNVDDKKSLQKCIDAISVASTYFPVVFPLHPRTEKRAKEFGLFASLEQIPHIRLCGPMDYFAFQKCIAHATCVITDSGGIQEETTFRKVPCLTLRANTERPVTVTEGTNTLIHWDETSLQTYLQEIISGRYKVGSIPALWDGHATERMFQVLSAVL